MTVPRYAEYEIVKRQLAVKGLISMSWTTNVRLLTHKYGLPSAHEVLINPPSKNSWKCVVKKAVLGYHLQKLKRECERLSTTRYVNLGACSLRKPHPGWVLAGSSRRELSRAIVKIRLLTGTYLLEGRKSHMRKSVKAGRCPLCDLETETREHFLLKCAVLEMVREPYMFHIGRYVNTRSLSEDDRVRLILDPSHFTQNQEQLQTLEETTRRLCYALHHHRLQLLQRNV